MSQPPRFVQIHFLTSYPCSLLNRDDTGFAKRIPFGSAVRTRVSSQCLKRHWRLSAREQAFADLCGPESQTIRSRYIFEQIARPLRREFDEETVNALVQEVSKVVLNPAQGRNSSTAQPTPSGLRTNQLIVLGNPEIDHLISTSRRLLEQGVSPGFKDIKKALGQNGINNLEAIGRGAGLDAALFGRMKTSDILADCDAALHVAHAFTVHEEDSEVDYFTAVDDLAREFDAGSVASTGHINAAELTTGLYYGYVAVDVPLLLANLEGLPPESWLEADTRLAGDILERFVHLVATVSPGAKRGATAPYSLADFVAVEAGDFQPCTWANAFFEPIGGPGLREEALQRIADHVQSIDRMYRPASRRRYASRLDRGLPAEIAEDAESLPDLARWAGDRIREGQ